MRPRVVAFLCLPLILFALAATAGPPSVEAQYEDARRSFYALFSSESQMADRDRWDKVIDQFGRIADAYPSHDRGRDAAYTLGLLHERACRRFNRSDDAEKGIAAFERVIRDHPKSSLVDDARRHVGDLKFLQRKNAPAATAYREADKLPVPRTPTARVGHGGGSLASLDAVKYYTRPGYTRVILELGGHTAYRAERIHGPERLFIDLLDTTVGTVPQVTRLDQGVVSAIRTAQNNSQVSRVVLDLAGNGIYHSVTQLQNPHRLIIDVGLARPMEGAATAKVTAADVRHVPPAHAAPPAKAAASPAPAAPVRSASVDTAGSTPGRSGVPVIVIDAGHGGKDPGAIGPGGLKEKDITLEVARELKRELESRIRCRVILTRDRDRFLELDERTVIANAAGADLFVSVHVNAAKDRSARGFETYFLSPARSKDELETAARENMVALRSGNEIENDLAYIMSDLSNTQKVNDSSQLASTVQSAMVGGVRRSYSGVRDKGVKQAMFYVLWNATMPSVLVETGFITNRDEAGKLKTTSFRRALASSIADGIVRYNRTYMVAVNR